jgi:23S rRNA pseudouridine1911/1915/1917 synthase
VKERRELLIQSSRVLWHDGDCCVINKLPGENPEDPVKFEDSLYPRGAWRAVHRLDVPVSGCLLLTCTPKAASYFSALFSSAGARGEVEKRYWAITEIPPSGVTLPGETWTAYTHWIVSDAVRNKSIAYTEEKKGGKKAVLSLRLAGRGDKYLFIEVDLLTGRHHQIRAQLAALGLRVKGDLKYGARRSEPEGGIRLHAASLAFPGFPDSRETVRVSAGPPVMDRLWSAFAESLAAPKPSSPVP